MQGRPAWNTSVRLLEDETLVAIGRLDYGDKKSGAFIAKLDYRGNKIWAIDQTGWNLAQVYDLAIDGQGDIYVIGRMDGESSGVTGERATMVKIGSDGALLWQSFLEPQDPAPAGYSRATRIALSLDEQRVWTVGVNAPSSGPLTPRAWSVTATDGKVHASVDLDKHGVLKNDSQPGFADLLVRHDGIYYAWNAQLQVGEDLLGWVSQVARMNEQGKITWKVEYGANESPGAVPHVLLRHLEGAAAGGVYVVGERVKVPVPDAAPVGERYGYVARFCPP